MLVMLVMDGHCTVLNRLSESLPVDGYLLVTY